MCVCVRGGGIHNRSSSNRGTTAVFSFLPKCVIKALLNWCSIKLASPNWLDFSPSQPQLCLSQWPHRCHSFSFPFTTLLGITEKGNSCKIVPFALCVPTSHLSLLSPTSSWDNCLLLFRCKRNLWKSFGLNFNKKTCLMRHSFLYKIQFKSCILNSALKMMPSLDWCPQSQTASLVWSGLELHYLIECPLWPSCVAPTAKITIKYHFVTLKNSIPNTYSELPTVTDCPYFVREISEHQLFMPPLLLVLEM